VLFKDRVTQALAHAYRYQSTLSVLFLDLDRFKVINDTLGHNVGELLLKQVADRLSPQDAGTVARRILEGLARPLLIDGHEITVTASVGIAIFPTDGDSVDFLLKSSDIAMYHAEDQGRNNFQFYSRTMNALAAERLEMENDLRKALERHEFIVYYQPQVDIRTNQ